MNRAIYSALEATERQRLKRKEAKKIRQAEEEHKKKIFNTVARAVNPNDAWSFCFE